MVGVARGGGALSIKQITGKPIKFISSGEKPDSLEEFHPDRMAKRILGMGDVVSLIESAVKVQQEEVEQEQAERMMRANLTLMKKFNETKKMMKKMMPAVEEMQGGKKGKKGKKGRRRRMGLPGGMGGMNMADLKKLQDMLGE